MEKMLHLLETFGARGSDGEAYVVHGYEHLARLDEVPGAPMEWEPTGLIEYKLLDGRHVSVGDDGTMSLAGTGIRLVRSPRDAAAVAPEPSIDTDRVSCDVCLREVPRSEAIIPEAADYVAYFCGLSCFERWKGLPEATANRITPARV